jgi:hypothetical protein
MISPLVSASIHLIYHSPNHFCLSSELSTKELHLNYLFNLTTTIIIIIIIINIITFAIITTIIIIFI